MTTPEITVRKLFCTPLLISHLDGAADMNHALLAHFLAQPAQEPGRRHSNLGGWQSDDNLQTLALPAAQSLCRMVTAVVDAATAVHVPGGLIEAALAWRMNAWVNINSSGASNAVHGHAGAFWSAIYYVDDGGAGPACGGELFFYDPRGLLPAMHDPLLRFRIEGCVTAGYTEKITPEAGMLLVFPSWLLHSVDPFFGTRPRVSVAFNFGTPAG
ncbi:TIGR02466 family protein [Massilia sp. S19_KUP03_FR1]|uniref:TIGR02466 family protein n=1 Tax=Massilia sp. S19_KUP03_FR1 TaxID=3025503 RepID=UPI002FCD86A6